MQQDPDFAEIVGLICKEDTRFDRKAYDFIRLGLDHTVKELKNKDRLAERVDAHPEDGPIRCARVGSGVGENREHS